jgi:DNA-binding NtrC family response regulator
MNGRNKVSRPACPDCRGSGQYVGLTVIESCQTCGGSGHLAPPRVDVIKSRVLDHRLFELVLSKQGYEVLTFESVGSYLHFLSDPPDCIITGWFFRSLGVPDLLSELVERELASPVVISTTLAIEPDELPEGVFAVLSDQALGAASYLQTIREAIAIGRKNALERRR